MFQLVNCPSVNLLVRIVFGANCPCADLYYVHTFHRTFHCAFVHLAIRHRATRRRAIASLQFGLNLTSKNVCRMTMCIPIPPPHEKNSGQTAKHAVVLMRINAL